MKIRYALPLVYEKARAEVKDIFQKISSVFNLTFNNFIIPFTRFIRLNLLPIIYFYSLFYTISVVKFFYINKIGFILVNLGYIKTYYLLNISHSLLYSSGIGFLQLFILYIDSYFRRNIYKHALIIFICFCLLGFSLLLFNVFEFLSLILFVLYGSLIATVFGLFNIRNRPDFIDIKEISMEIKLELIKIRISNWWRGLSLLTSILIALFVTALVSWVLNPPPENAKIISDYTLKSSSLLFVSALPGILYIYLKIFRQINYLENCVLELGIKSNELA